MLKFVSQKILIVFTLLLTCGLAQAQTPSIDIAKFRTILQEAQGQVLIVNFFASWCPPCREEIPGLIRLQKEIGPEKLKIIGISLDEKVEMGEKFIQQTDFNYAVFRDAEFDMASFFKVSSIPHNVIYDATGKVVYNDAGYISHKELTRIMKKYLPQ